MLDAGIRLEYHSELENAKDEQQQDWKREGHFDHGHAALIPANDF
jgi:hypothetical protein